MQMYVGITDYDWFEFLKSKNAKEVNFWKPGTQPFKALEENDLFLFKLHAPRDYIVGGRYLWAPQQGNNGSVANHSWSRMKNVKSGDVIIHLVLSPF